MTIKQAIFAVESMAHLQGKERELLPIVESARAELEEIRVALSGAYAALSSPASNIVTRTMTLKNVEAALAILG